MKVKAIKIKNILGVESLEIAPGKITVIEGKNETGKTSVLEAIKAALKGGHDATLLRNGAEVGEVVLVMDDGVEIRKPVTKDKSDVSYLDPKFGRSSKPQTTIDKLIDALAVNPVEFLMAPESKRAAYLLEAMPLVIKKEQLAGITDFVPDGHAFDVLEKLNKKFYDERTGVNRVLREKKAGIENLKKTLPEEEQANIEEISVKVKNRTFDLQSVKDRKAVEREKKIAEFSSSISACRDEKTRSLDAINKEADRLIDDAKNLVS